jgi:hypothetical protein
MFNEGGELLTERPGVLLVQIDLVLRAADYEPYRLVCRASIEIVFEGDGYLLRHPGLLDCDQLSAPYKITCNSAATTTPPVASDPLRYTVGIGR